MKISLPSLRITETLKKIPALLAEGRRGGLTLAPEVARDDMREQIRKPIDNQDLYDGAAEAFRRGWRKVKLYFMCGLPGERPADLDGIVEMAETIARIGKDVTGRYADVTASVSNFVPKPHTPYQWNGMQTREYFHWAHRYLRSRVKIRSVTVKCHDIERSLLEGILTRGDRRVAAALEEAWRRGARLDAWTRALRPQALVGDLRRPRHRRPVLQPARPAGRRGPALGPHPRQEGPRVPRQGADPLGRPARRRWPGPFLTGRPRCRTTDAADDRPDRRSRRRRAGPGSCFGSRWPGRSLVRVPLVLNAAIHLDSDLAVDGLTLLDATHGHWRWHYPGTPLHRDRPGPALAARRRWSGGRRPITLVSGGVGRLRSGSCSRRSCWPGGRSGPGVAAWSLVPLAFASTGTVWLSGRITGGHLLAAAWHAGAFALLARVPRRGAGRAGPRRSGSGAGSGSLSTRCSW